MKNLICAGILCLLCVFSGCRGEDGGESEKISSIEFEVEKVEVNVNETFIVKVKAETEEGKKNEKIVYTVVPDGNGSENNIEILEESNDSFLVKGLRRGSAVIKADSERVHVMLEVKVYGEDVLARYIKLDKPVIEVDEGSRVMTSVSLFGKITEPDDNVGFQYILETGKNNIGIQHTGNMLTITGIERGHQEIVVKHPKADFDNKILVFVKGVDEEIKYIYRESNVLTIPNNGQYYDFDVSLINGQPEDSVDFSYEVLRGQDVIEITGQQTKCNVKSKKNGTAVINIKHPLAACDFEILIIVYEVTIPYISLDQTFMLLNTNGEGMRVTAEIVDSPNIVLSKNLYSFAIMEGSVEVPEASSIIMVVQTNESFYVRARRSGTARLVIHNDQASVDREVLVIVRDEIIYRDHYYITTETNVITTQVGAAMSRLSVRLVNGNSSHANNFEWIIDDNTIARLYTNHGNVIHRLSRAAANITGDVFEAYVDIEPLKAGTVKIVVTNTSFPETMATVIVRVYPAGTFVTPPLEIGYDGLIKVEYGKPETITMRMLQGDISEMSSQSLDWSIEDPLIAGVLNTHGMQNILTAKMTENGGITKMIVKGTPGTNSRLEHPHESIVIAGDADYIARTQVIYVDNIYHKVVEQQTIDIPVLNSSVNQDGTPNLSWRSNEFSVSVVKPDVLYAVMVQNKLKLMGKARGETDVIVSHPGAANGFITLHVTIEPANISVAQPYFISLNNEIEGVVRGVGKTLSVTMPGAPESELNKLVWSSDDSTIVRVTGSGSSVLVTGMRSNYQAFINIAHKDNKAEPRKILVYVIETADELKNVILGVPQENYLLKTGTEQLITVLTNAKDMNKKDISWSVITKPGDTPAITVDSNYDSAMVRAVAAGNAEIQVTYTDYEYSYNSSTQQWDKTPTDKFTRPASIFVSVVDALGAEKVIKGPAVIEIIKSESKIIGVEHLNLMQEEIMGIQWAVETNIGEEPLANIEGNGDSAYIMGLRKGVGKVKIWNTAVKYTHYATLVCANTPEELASMYVMGVESSYQKMMLGDEKKVKLVFGSNGFPEMAKRNLVWKADDTGRVKIAGSPGDSVSIIAEDVGEATVTVTDTSLPDAVSFNKTLEMKFLVLGPGQSTYEFRGYQKMVGIVVGQSKSVEIHLWDGGEEIKNYDLWKHEEDDNGAKIRVNMVEGDTIGQKLDIQALSVGQAYITVTYNKTTSAKILVYTALTADELENYYPILVEKTNYLLQIGETATVRIETMEDKDSVLDKNGKTKFENITWGIENVGVIENVNFTGKKREQVKGKAAGNAVLTVNYNSEPAARIFITVVSNDVIDFEKYIITENIIGLVMGDSPRPSKIFHNLGSSVSSVVWESLNPQVVTVSGTGEEAQMTAVSVGETYVTVAYGSWLKRYIRVYVQSSKTDVDVYKAMNIENQYYRAGIGENLVLPVYFAPNKSTQPTIWVDKYENKVVSFESKENGSKIEIETKNEGVAVLEGINVGINDTGHVIRIYVEVSMKYNGQLKPVINKYLTINKTIWVMNPDEKNEELELVLTGVGYTEDEARSVTWAIKDNGGEYIDIYPNGFKCRVRVNPVGKEGTAEISASSAQNEIIIRVVVSRTGIVGFPYIVGQDTIKVGVGQKVMIPYDVAEVATYDMNAFYAQVIGNQSSVGTVKFTRNMLEIEGKISGTALIRITCEPTVSYNHYKDVQVNVTTTADGMMYLTTRDNFTQVKIGEVKTLSVSLVGVDNPTESGYIWSIDETDNDYLHNYLELNYVGNQAQVRGLSAGAGKIVKLKVVNNLIPEMFALSMYVRISDNWFSSKYMTTSQNIVTVVEGRSMYLTAELVNGDPGEDSQIYWEDIHKDIAKVQGTGTQAYVLAEHLGFATIRAHHSSAVNGYIEILVIVEKNTAADNIYITSGDTLVIMKPGETRPLEAQLVGPGTGIGDERGFEWRVYDEKTKTYGLKNDYLEINGNASGINKIYVFAKKEGESTVRVTHPGRTNYILNLKIYVQENSKIEFNSGQVTINVLEQKVINVSMPPNATVIYSVSEVGIVKLSTTGPTSSKYLVIEGVKKGITVITALCEQYQTSDELIVEVVDNTPRKAQYIETSDSIFNMLDWQSAANRVVVQGTTVGEKDNGGVFTDSDSLNIEWEIAGTNNEFIGFDKIEGVALSQTNGITNNSKATGKLVSIYSKKQGVAEIKIKHNDMSGYEKKVYVNVMPYEGSFIMTPVFQNMEIGQKVVFSVNIAGNVGQEEYDKVSWQLFPAQVENQEVYGVVFESNKKYTESKKEIVQVVGEKSGVYKIKSFYQGHELEGIIYVEPPKKLEVYDESFVKVTPGSTVFIGLYHEPPLGRGDEFEFNTDYNAYVDVGYVGRIKDEKTERVDLTLFDAAGKTNGSYKGDYGYDFSYPIKAAFTTSEQNRIANNYPKYNAVLVAHAKEREGYTQIKIKYKGIERIVTIHNSMDYDFNMLGITSQTGKNYNATDKMYKATSIRGKPGDKVTIKYEIQPVGKIIVHGNTEYDKDTGEINKDTFFNGVLMKSDGALGPHNRTLDKKIVTFPDVNYTTLENINNDKTFNYANQTITMNLLRCGYTMLRFENDLLKGKIGRNLEIPVYIYYETIDPKWKYSVHYGSGGSEVTKSRVDFLGNAIYLANDEVLFVEVEKAPYPSMSLINRDGKTVYTGDDFDFSDIRVLNSSPSGTVIKSGFSSIYEDQSGNNGFPYKAEYDDKKILYAISPRAFDNPEQFYYSNYICFFMRGGETAVPTSGKDSLLEVKYRGNVEIFYQYSNGGADKTTQSKNFLLYTEKWAIKQR